MANIFSDLLHLIAYQISKAVTKDIRDKCSQIITNQRTITYLYRVILGRNNVKQIFVDEQSCMEIFNASQVLKSGRCIMKI